MTPAARDREPLSRERILAAALSLIDSAGAERLSMRRLGQHLEVDPMAVYYYVPNKAALYDGIVEHLWAAVTLPPPAPDETWHELIIAVFTGFRAALLEHPRAIVIVGTRPATSATMLRLVDAVLGRLAAAGLAGADAMELIDCLAGYTIGKVLAETGETLGGDADTVAAALASVTPQTHPHLVSVVAAGYALDPEGEFHRGLRALVLGWR